MTNNYFTKLLALATMVFLGACSNKVQEHKELSPAQVTIENTASGYSFFVNGERFSIHGAGINWDDGHNFKALAEAGGNTFRTWNHRRLGQELDSASKYGLMVAAGFDLAKELHGFDYSIDHEVMHEQRRYVEETVEKYKNHPNLLCWVVGNEMNLKFGDDGELVLVDSSTYIYLDELVKKIKDIDSNHPVTTTFAAAIKEHIDLAYAYCPDIDFLSVQVYGDLKVVPNLIRGAEYTGPYLVTEFGPTGHWEMPLTEWDREIEETNAVKAAGMVARIQAAVEGDSTNQSLGYIAFEWGQKQERTPTWYGMFLKSGEPSSRIDELTKWWTGSYPANRAPLIDSIKLNHKFATENIRLKPGQEYIATIFHRDPENDPITYDWRLMKEVDVRSDGGAFEQEPNEVIIDKLYDENGKLIFITPATPGEYRLFSYIYDSGGKAGYANVPFYVEK